MGGTGIIDNTRDRTHQDTGRWLIRQDSKAIPREIQCIFQSVFHRIPASSFYRLCARDRSEVEETTLKHVTILGALLALGTAPVAAQQQAAVLQRMRGRTPISAALAITSCSHAFLQGPVRRHATHN